MKIEVSRFTVEGDSFLLSVRTVGIGIRKKLTCAKTRLCEQCHCDICSLG